VAASINAMRSFKMLPDEIYLLGCTHFACITDVLQHIVIVLAATLARTIVHATRATLQFAACKNIKWNKGWQRIYKPRTAGSDITVKLRTSKFYHVFGTITRVRN
jgi:glutamate racemase